jgi:transcription-repair coupling factor (superfamily II helicase)
MPSFGPQQNSHSLAAPLLAALTQADSLAVRKLSPNARAWLAASLARSGAGPLLWIVPDEISAENCTRAAKFFLGDGDPDPADPFAARVVHFPLHQSSPYEDLSPDRFAVAERLALLFRLSQKAPPDLIVASLPAVMRRCMPRATIDHESALILQGQEIDQTELVRNLSRIGFLNVPLVEDPGSFAKRGGIIDIFSPLLPMPVRIELFGDEVEAIRAFDPETQRTICKMDSFYFSPVRELFLDDVSQGLAVEAVTQRSAQLDLPSHVLLTNLRNIKDGTWFFGIESLLPAFHDRLDCLFDFLDPTCKVILDDHGSIEARAEDDFLQAQNAAAENIKALNLTFPAESMLLTPSEFLTKTKACKRLLFGLSDEAGRGIEIQTDDVSGLRQSISMVDSQDDPLKPLIDLLGQWRSDRIRPFVVASRPARAREMATMLRSRKIPTRIEEGDFDPDWADQTTPTPPVRIVAGELSGGFSCKEALVGFIPASEIFGRPIRRAKARAPKTKVAALRPGDLVVHVDFGIGRFDGMHRLEVSGSEADYLLLGYRGGDRLYLPVTRMGLIERYQSGRGADGQSPLLNKLGTKSWERTKLKVKEALLEMADDLIRLEAQRRSQPGLAVDHPGEDYAALAASFPYQETEDQQHAIDEIVADMTKNKVMDRLVCGDVGFGKTEVAIRAAYLSALMNRQTVILVPTTILALQHMTTFKARLEERALRVEMISRLVKASDQKKILADLADGSVDVLIGTHRLLRDDVKIKSLGLLIIDEEHRFGVKHKEKLKSLKKNVDVLTMTATPLPRTLQMSLTGLRDISVIQTAPPGRRSIRTLVTRFSKRVVKEAIQRELQRGGQVFFVHNWVRSLASMKRFIERTVPEARCALAHGQMKDRDLEQVMSDFVGRKIDVLICTSIIESGLDIPSANTIIVNRADFFGLSQLHQIRGRVGRAVERAYAYLLIPGLSSITKDARRRLEVLSDLSDVGAGYRIAAEDLEIRGAGNLLGKAQSGHVAAVGFDLYGRMLERAIAQARGQSTGPEAEPEISLPIACLLPEDYVPEVDQRMEIYARLSRAANEEEVFEIEQELVDRFGPEPDQVQNLCELMSLKTLLRRANILTLEAKKGVLHFGLDLSSNIDAAKLVQLAQEQSERISFDPEGVLKVTLGPDESAELIPAARAVALRLQSSAKPE